MSTLPGSLPQDEDHVAVVDALVRRGVVHLVHRRAPTTGRYYWPLHLLVEPARGDSPARLFVVHERPLLGFDRLQPRRSSSSRAVVFLLLFSLSLRSLITKYYPLTLYYYYFSLSLRLRERDAHAPVTSGVTVRRDCCVVTLTRPRPRRRPRPSSAGRAACCRCSCRSLSLSPSCYCYCYSYYTEMLLVLLLLHRYIFFLLCSTLPAVTTYYIVAQLFL